MSKHRKARRPVLAGAALVPVSAMAVIAGAGHAAAAPTTSQPGVTAPTTSQPGVTAPTTSQPGVTGTRSNTTEWQYLPGFDPGEFRNVETVSERDTRTPRRATPAQAAPAPAAPATQGNSGGQQASYAYQTPQTQAVEEELPDLVTDTGLVKPIQAEEGEVRFGVFKAAKPEWLSEEYANQLNNTSSVLEARGATAFNSLGIPTTRSQRVAAGAVGGATLGAVVLGAPAAVIGGTVGSLLGTGVMTVFPYTCTPVMMIGCVVLGGAGGAAAAGLPAAALGAVVGGAIGAAYGAGEAVGEVEEGGGFDKAALIAQTRHVVGQVEAAPGGVLATNGFRTVSDTYQDALDNGRDLIAAQPNGAGILAQIDGIDQTIKNIVNPGHEAGDAVGIGVHFPTPGTGPGEPFFIPADAAAVPTPADAAAVPTPADTVAA